MELPALTGAQNFTFIEHQLSAYSGAEGAVSGLRWSQQGAVSPWADSTLLGGNVAMTVGIDLSDPGSPCGDVHIRNKTAVAERMALAARHFAYGHNIKFTGPVAQSLAVNSNGIEITFSGATPPLEFRTIAQTTNASQQGFELMYATMDADELLSTTGSPTDNFTWVPAKASTVGEADRVLVELPTAAAGKIPLAIRYAWRSIPTTQLLYDATPVGGGYGGLPAPPFFATCSGNGTCMLVPPGLLPASAGGSTGGGGKHALPVAPWAPPSTACTFTNNTTVGATPIASGLVAFLDQVRHATTPRLDIFKNAVSPLTCSCAKRCLLSSCRPPVAACAVRTRAAWPRSSWVQVTAIPPSRPQPATSTEQWESQPPTRATGRVRGWQWCQQSEEELFSNGLENALQPSHSKRLQTTLAFTLQR